MVCFFYDSVDYNPWVLSGLKHLPGMFMIQRSWVQTSVRSNLRYVMLLDHTTKDLIQQNQILHLNEIWAILKFSWKQSSLWHGLAAAQCTLHIWPGINSRQAGLHNRSRTLFRQLNINPSPRWNTNPSPGDIPAWTCTLSAFHPSTLKSCPPCEPPPPGKNQKD